MDMDNAIGTVKAIVSLCKQKFPKQFNVSNKPNNEYCAFLNVQTSKYDSGCHCLINLEGFVTEFYSEVNKVNKNFQEEQKYSLMFNDLVFCI